MALRFEWDDQKRQSNQRKHGIDFDEARSVFADSLARIFFDEDHSKDEDREIIVGHSDQGRLLIVSFTERGVYLVRIISARAATRKERQAYEEQQDI